ncbi:MAG: DUF5069 domain-containing protein [Verrucomicrobia bacterium]|nr:MAG: DUF5069 domain-containing protein [Verrucomicrobiota bacterium]
MNWNAPDLAQHPPRSPRVRLGGYVILPRLLDKCRASIADRAGEYNYDCPLDKRFFEFVGIDAKALKAHVELGAGDGEILAWIKAHAKHRRSPWEIEAWSAWQETRVPVDADSRAFFTELHRKAGPNRNDIAGWFDLLDLDDHVSFGGKA